MEEHPEARFIVETLRKNGYIAYYAGGWVRDFLLNLPSDDIDIATDAPAEEVQKIFKKTVPIGISFGIVLVVMDQKQYEVATFRKDLEYADGRRPSKIAYSSPEEDALRRDFTINGMFYDPIEKNVIDLVEGQKDLDAKIIRAIGNPHERIREDRLRMIRAIRLSVRFKFTIEKKTSDAILAHQTELFPAVAIERIIQELKKMHQSGHLKNSLLLLAEYGLLQQIFPQVEQETFSCLKKDLSVLDQFPPETPFILCLMQLFPKMSVDFRLILCEYLKCSNQEKNLIDFFYSHIEFFKHDKRIDLHHWAHFYAHPSSELCISVYSGYISQKDRKKYFDQHEMRKSDLRAHIFRIENQKPLVSAEFLQKQGISPGPQMGKLLKKAEEISINQTLDTPEAVFEKLKPFLHDGSE